MLRWFPRLQVATACFSCSHPDLNFLDPYVWVGKSTTQLTIGLCIIYARRRHVSALAMGHLQVLTIVLRVLCSVCYKLGTWALSVKEIFMYMHYNHCHRATTNLQLNILLLLLLYKYPRCKCRMSSKLHCSLSCADENVHGVPQSNLTPLFKYHQLETTERILGLFLA
jgi:hypothetical protein